MVCKNGRREKKEVKKNGGDKMGETTIGVEKKVLTKNVEKKR